MTSIATGTLGNSSAAIGVGGALPTLVTSNPEGEDYTPNQQYVMERAVIERKTYGAGADLGAFVFSGARRAPGAGTGVRKTGVRRVVVR
jgi:hypothetical protein